MFFDKLNATGRLNIKLYDKNHIIKKEIDVPNLVVTVGKEYITDRMTSNATSVMSHMAVGIDNTNLASANTTLESEVAGSRTALTSSTVTGNSVEYVATFSEGVGTGALVEAGIFNSGTNGIMLCRTTFGVVNKEATDTLTINWTVTVN